MKKSYFLITIGLITLSVIFRYNICKADINSKLKENSFTNNRYTISYDFDEKDKGYKESQFRRFEIIFFISMPASLIFSLLGTEAYKIASKNTGRFEPIEYSFLAFSTLGISFTIAMWDNRIVYKKVGY